MNKATIEKLMSKEPEDGPPFQFKPGRYYVGMWHIDLPASVTRFGKGGDIVACLWRKDAEPTRWHFMYRFRHYRAGRHADPWATENTDVKTWNKAIYSGTKVDAMSATAAFFSLAGLASTAVCGLTLGEPDFFAIGGDDTAFFKAVKTRCPRWLNLRIEEIPSK